MIFIRVLCVRDDVTGIPVGLDVRNGEEFTHGLDVAGGNTCSRAKNHFTSGGDFTTYFLRDVEAIIRRHFLHNVRHKHLAEDIIVEINFLHRPLERQFSTFVFGLKKSINSDRVRILLGSAITKETDRTQNYAP